MSVIDLEHKRFHRIACLTIVLVGLIVYSNTIHSSFHFDDSLAIVNNPLIRDLRNIPQFFQKDAYGSASRGVATTSFAISYYLSGSSVAGYHWANISIHLLNGILVYFLAVIILNQYFTEAGGRDTAKVHALALFAALLFTTSPIQTHTVNYIVQRSGELATTFYLLSFIFFTKAVSQNSVSVPLYAWSVVFFLGGIWCKEIAYTAFIMMFLYYLCFVSRGWRGWPRCLKLMSPYIVLAVVSMHLVVPLHNAPPLGVQLPIGEDITATVEHPWQYPLTQAHVIIEYIKLLALPLPGRLNVDYDVTPVDTIWEPYTAACAIIIIGLLCVALTFLNKTRLLAFSTLWFLVTLIPTSSIFPLGEFMTCYRLYLPGLGFYLLLVAGVHKVFCYLGARRGIEQKQLWQTELVVFISIVLFYSVCAYEHNKVWKTDITLWEDVVKKSPNKLRPYYNLGFACQAEGLVNRAMEEYSRCEELYANTPNMRSKIESEICSLACNNMGGVYFKAKQYNKAITAFKKAREINYYNVHAYSNLGMAYILT
ncbi:MAG: tetratricopeptide repeat protein, partial [Candidatus Brocadiales bacterium]